MDTDWTIPLLLNGYEGLTRLRSRAGRDTVSFRFLGRRATCLVGPDAAELFYDPETFDREGVVPPHVQKTLFGDTAVHLLSGPEHLTRKSLFLSALDVDGTRALTASVVGAFDEAAGGWGGAHIVLFDAAAEVLTRAVHDWAGVPLRDPDVAATARDMVSMVDGFATVGPRYGRARRARLRQEDKIAALAVDIRAGRGVVRQGSPMELALRHRDVSGEPLDEHTVAVEMLNLLRPTVAVAWLVSFAAHALHHWPVECALLDRAERGRATAFAHEVRRFYPFVPALGARAVRDASFDGVEIPRGSLGLLDVFGQNHHPALWQEPWRFSSHRFMSSPPGMYDLVPQGGGDPETGHRCPGEPVAVSILEALAPRLLRLVDQVPPQDLRVTRRRVPARVRSGVRVRPVVRHDAGSPSATTVPS